jgi:hypothetical protein
MPSSNNTSPFGSPNAPFASPNADRFHSISHSLSPHSPHLPNHSPKQATPALIFTDADGCPIDTTVAGNDNLNGSPHPVVLVKTEEKVVGGSTDVVSSNAERSNKADGDDENTTASENKNGNINRNKNTAAKLMTPPRNAFDNEKRRDYTKMWESVNASARSSDASGNSLDEWLEGPCGLVPPRDQQQVGAGIDTVCGKLHYHMRRYHQDDIISHVFHIVNDVQYCRNFPHSSDRGPHRIGWRLIARS